MIMVEMAKVEEGLWLLEVEVEVEVESDVDLEVALAVE